MSDISPCPPERNPAADVLIGIGSNIDPAANVTRAITRLRETFGVAAVSRFYRSSPVGRKDQADFLNGAARLRTRMSRGELRDTLRQIEADLGRVRDPDDRHGPRTIDLDILIGPDGTCDADLTRRWFAAVPAAEVWPGRIVDGQQDLSQIAATFGKKVGPSYRLDELSSDGGRNE